MSDMKKVIKGLECCCEHISGMDCNHCPYNEEYGVHNCNSELAYDALNLLKGREIVQVKLNEDGANTEWDNDMMTIDDFIQELNIAIKQDGHDIYMKRDDATMIKQIIINNSNIVRCKDCKHHLECDYWIEHGDDWFCADGKRKEE